MELGGIALHEKEQFRVHLPDCVGTFPTRFPTRTAELDMPVYRQSCLVTLAPVVTAAGAQPVRDKVRYAAITTQDQSS